MKVTLIDCTGLGSPNPGRYAANLLVYTKSTRLKMTPGLVGEIASWPWGAVLKELEYMANTIPSSWEFIHYSFLIEDVTRAFTHQLVRTRTASFAQQSMRTLKMDGWGYEAGPSIEGHSAREAEYHGAMAEIEDAYRHLIGMGVPAEDARGILPTNIHTNINMSLNLRGFVDLCGKRSSPRTQSEYRGVVVAMKEAVLKVHPWASIFIDTDATSAAEQLWERIDRLPITSGEKTSLIKLLDLVRNG